MTIFGRFAIAMTMIVAVMVGVVFWSSAPMAANLVLTTTMQVTTTSAPAPVLLGYNGVVVIRSHDGAGSGFVFAEDELFYYVGTAQHVVGIMSEIEVDEVGAEVILIDIANDVAIVRVKKHKIIYPVYPLGGDVQLEDHVYAVGYTWGNGWNADPTFMVYHGRITCLNWDQCLSSNSGLFPGMSGGPLFNKDREVIGITSRVAGAWGCPITTLSIFVPVEHLTALWDRYQTTAVPAVQEN